MQHFFLTPDCIHDSEIFFPPEISRQITQVLRAGTGDQVIVRDGTGRELLVELVIDGKKVTGKAKSIQTRDREPALKLHLFFALSQRERVETILQKCTEVGVAEFTPFITSRTLVQEKEKAEQKRERWQAIIREAAEQSERGIVPRLNPVGKFSEVMSDSPQEDLKILAWEQEDSRTIRSVIEENTGNKVALMIGPEGGFADDEFELAKNAGWIPVTLGKRILRMETAAIVAAAFVLESSG